MDCAKRFGARLNSRDRELFESRWLAEDPPTLEEMGRRFGVSRERARQREDRVLARFRDFSPQLAEAA
jgi:RNA polymerase sigma-32 factor